MTDFAPKNQRTRAAFSRCIPHNFPTVLHTKIRVRRKRIQKFAYGGSQVWEIRDPGSPYFERAFFFVKPEYAFTGEQTLRRAAEETLTGTDRLPRTRRRRIREIALRVLGAAAAAAGGAIVTAILLL